MYQYSGQDSNPGARFQSYFLQELSVSLRLFHSTGKWRVLTEERKEVFVNLLVPPDITSAEVAQSRVSMTRMTMSLDDGRGFPPDVFVSTCSDGRVNETSVVDAVDSGSIPNRVKETALAYFFWNFLLHYNFFYFIFLLELSYLFIFLFFDWLEFIFRVKFFWLN